MAISQRLTLILAAALASIPLPSHAEDNMSQTIKDQQAHPYVGMWVTKDGRIRQELLPNGRYDEARGTRESAYQGRYVVTGTHIDYWDDTGFTADGTFVSPDVLHHGGMVFYRRK
ncbi:Atu4866 domain-containing protein [Rhizobium glycinendophyticum]|uniref:Atu4866 domain-containing protein n=1 Tax=Rhizobium glycinendophyticum TaxID=2589807 RepID=A0A504UYW5_9HYPH|nr:Atu4866 domain-containing protein [Rhizobium glycinendophyticum]TPP11971.1 hypothetical protein FJQ55_14615 [Rhizobium glycinendophyticum]